MKTKYVMAAAVAALTSLGAYAQTVDEIVDKHVAALGGMDKINGVKTMIVDRSLSVQGMDIPSSTTVVVGKSLKSESMAMGNSMIVVIDGTTGWSIRPAMMGGTGDPEDMPAEQIKQQMGQLSPFGTLVNYKTNGTKVELVGKEKVDKKDVYHLKLTTAQGQAIDEYLDANTYLVSKVKTSMNGQAGEVNFSDYQTVDGLKFANTMELANPIGQMVFTTNKVTINPPVDNAIFKKPAK